MSGKLLAIYSEDNPSFGVDKTLLLPAPGITQVSQVIQSS